MKQVGIWISVSTEDQKVVEEEFSAHIDKQKGSTFEQNLNDNK